MKTLDEIRAILQQNREVLAERYGVAIAGIFGSYVRGEQKPDSDLDLLADILTPIDLLTFIGAENYLSDALGVKVDLVPKRRIRKELREYILNEAIAP